MLVKLKRQTNRHSNYVMYFTENVVEIKIFTLKNIRKFVINISKKYEALEHAMCNRC